MRKKWPTCFVVAPVSVPMFRNGTWSMPLGAWPGCFTGVTRSIAHMWRPGLCRTGQVSRHFSANNVCVTKTTTSWNFLFWLTKSNNLRLLLIELVVCHNRMIVACLQLSSALACMYRAPCWDIYFALQYRPCHRSASHS
jgi:hypothetical protein